MQNFVKYLNGKSNRYILISAIVFSVIIGFFDFLIGPEIGLSIFFILPIYIATWIIGKKAGFALSAISVTIWLLSKIIAGQTAALAFPGYVHYWNALIRLSFFVVIVLIIDKWKIMEFLAMTDALTLVGNRRYFRELVEVEINRSLRYNRPFTAAYVDIDDFKNVNDTYGHDSGDALLKLVAETIKTTIRSTDIFARLGGDEFALVLPETDAESAVVIFSKLHNLLSKRTKKKWQVTFSLGVVTFITPPRSIDDMLKRVDSIMYSAKKQGNGSVIYEIFE